MNRHGPVPQCGPYLIGEVAPEPERDLRLTIASLRAYLADANLANANLAGAYLTDANLAGAYLAGANLTDA